MATAEMSVIWLRLATVLYSLGLLHAILTLVRRKEHLFRVALAAFSIGGVFHFVSIVEKGVHLGRCPTGTFYDSLSMCAFLVAVGFLVVHARYKLTSVGVFIFPVVFLMTLVSSLGSPVGAWSSPVVRNAWLSTHIVLVLLGYAALLFSAVGTMLYVFQERELKARKPRKLYYRLPPLGTLDELISRAIAVGFALITLAVVSGSIWAFIELKSNWIRQPKIAVSFVTWGLYMAMAYLRITAGWRGRKAAILASVVVAASALTWVAHAKLGALLLKP